MQSGATEPDLESGRIQSHIFVDERMTTSNVASLAVLVQPHRKVVEHFLLDPHPAVRRFRVGPGQAHQLT
jgi:hypothetical protein